MTRIGDRYLVPQFPVQVVEDLVFGQSRNVLGETETLRLDVYMPGNDPLACRPAIFWFHGGGFRPGNDRRQIYIPMFARAFAARGYVGVAPDYRLRAEPQADRAGAIRDAVADGRMALEWVRANCAPYRIDPKRIALAGGSAGGILVMNLVHDADRPVKAIRDGIFAAMSMWGAPGGDRRLFHQVNPESPPTLLVHGTADQLIPYRYAQELAQELGEAGLVRESHALEGAPHTPIREHWDEIVETTVRFLRQHLPVIRDEELT